MEKLKQETLLLGQLQLQRVTIPIEMFTNPVPHPPSPIPHVKPVGVKERRKLYWYNSFISLKTYQSGVLQVLLLLRLWKGLLIERVFGKEKRYKLDEQQGLYKWYFEKQS